MSWERKRLEDVADFTLGKMLDQKKNKGEPLPYLANVNVRWGSFDLDGLRQMRFEPHEAERFGLKCGDIIMCEGGEPGRCAIWKDYQPRMMIQKALHRIRPHDGLDNRFLFYTFLHKGKTGGFSPLFTGSTIKHLPREKLAKVEVDIPPVPTQKHIVSILSAYDDLIENNRRRIQLLEQAARLLYKEWFVHLRFPGHDRSAGKAIGTAESRPAGVSAKDGANQHVKMKDGVPEGWGKKPLGELLTLQRGFDLPVRKRKEGHFPIYASTGINGYHAEARVKGPGVVTGRSGSLGKVMFVSGDFWPLNTTLWVKEFKIVGPHFATHLLENMQLDQYNGGAAVPTLNRNDVHRVEVLCPPPLLLQIFEDYGWDIIQQIDVLKSMIGQLERARDLLLPRLMNGEIAV